MPHRCFTESLAWLHQTVRFAFFFSLIVALLLRRSIIDVADTVKQVFDQFDIGAVRADDIEHEGVITKRILDEIETAEFLLLIANRRAP